MTDIIKIKCPHCSTILSVRQQAGIESKSVVCPICKQKTPFLKYKFCDVSIRPEKDMEESCTQYAISNGGNNFNVYNSICLVPGSLNILPQGNIFQLKIGKNIVGRKVATSLADFKIETGENKYLSREHLVIEVKKEEGKGIVHYASLYKEKVNATYINNERLEFGDCIILKRGDVIKLPGVELLFDVTDSDETKFY